MHCDVERYKSNELIEMCRVLPEKLKILTLKSKILTNIKT